MSDNIRPLFGAGARAAVPPEAEAAGMALLSGILHDIAALQSAAAGHQQVLESFSGNIILLGQGISAACTAAAKIAELRARVAALEALIGAPGGAGSGQRMSTGRGRA